ncbi:hypothetical protein D046_0952A, partial [Vibrio parahaemolyticus V-223/04]
MVATHKPAH